ncbi:GAF domain-containing protein [Mangrovivirga sp. M17]|uniref:GAF domain-containing protein n=1 Tax=Mangrovivirga halotolerans TaxID=2993936 RepID=A0ABT3RLW0_9BACT|nr:GAF domain-containing protein [Mangrovivirga halotolerans]MCX2742805.1 GAF domain-containing protein [Mangrovivirga halotolerans]
MNFFNTLFDLGVSDDMDNSLKYKVKLTNIVAVTLLVLIVVYTIISAIIYTPLVPYCIGGLIGYASVLIFNQYGFQSISRFFVSILPTIVVALLHAVIVSEGEQVNIQVYLFNFAVLVLPWAVFSLKEYKSIILTFGFNLLIFFSMDEINSFIEPEETTDVFNEGWVKLSVLIGAISFSSFIVIFLQYLNSQFSNEMRSLLKKYDEESRLAKEKEKETTKYLKELERSQEEEKKRNWATQGLAEIGALLRKSDDLQELCDEIISFTVNYLKANQGALFLVNSEDNDVKLELKATYAYSRKKFEEKTIRPGQGLVGQVYLEKSSLLLKEIPGNYVRITSGLGDATPGSLIIVPMIVNEEVHGIFEIASFKEFEEYQISFLEGIGENIATSLNSIQVNDKTKRLLEESQEYTEQLQASEEEMRQNLEEMQAIQENQTRLQNEVAEKQAQLSEKIEKIDKFNFVLDSLRTTAEVSNGDPDGLKLILEEIAKVMKVSMASYWSYSPSASNIVCENNYELFADEHQSGQKWSRQEIPNFFKGLDADKVIKAGDISNHENTFELKEKYLSETDVVSMLSVPVYIGGKNSGILKVDHEDSYREWSQEELTFMKSAADLITILYQNSKEVS